MLSPEAFEAWCKGIGIAPYARALMDQIRTSDPARRVGGGRSNVSGRYTVTEVIQRLHVWHRRMRGWVSNGWIKIGRNRRITERSLRSFLREHSEELKWDLFDSETVEWLLEFGVAAPAGKARAVGQGD